MSVPLSRREFVVGMASVGLVSSGCGTESTDSSELRSSIPIEVTPEDTFEVVQHASTPSIYRLKIALHGYAIVAAKIGGRLVQLPHPAVRILGVTLVISAIGSEIVIVYLDDELQRRQIRETVSEEVRIQIEGEGAVTFLTENGKEESVVIGDTQYDDSPK